MLIIIYGRTIQFCYYKHGHPHVNKPTAAVQIKSAFLSYSQRLIVFQRPFNNFYYFEFGLYGDLLFGEYLKSKIIENKLSVFQQ